MDCRRRLFLLHFPNLEGCRNLITFISSSMKWEEIEAVLEKTRDLHDKLSRAIHSISQAHFFFSIKSHITRKPNVDKNSDGFAYFKDFIIGVDADESAAALQEIKTLNAIRSSLESLEDQLEFFRTVQALQQAERDAALACLEQSRIVLAMQLAEYQGKKYKVIEQAQALVGDVRNASCFISSKNTPGASPTRKKFSSPKGERSNAFVKVFLSSFRFVKKSLNMDQAGGLLGNAALVALSMLALMHLHQVGVKDKNILDFPPMQEDVYERNMTKIPRHEGSSSGRSTQLDVLLARG
ncbi:hypothetical protein ACH5RR_019756 [Cinchona calisaya]|uniref:Plastid division protein PDV1 n=1 Tax=Cinchona calisaya TaxID=153742 RepID=A0ABD2ZQA6_9GENT